MLLLLSLQVQEEILQSVPQSERIVKKCGNDPSSSHLPPEQWAEHQGHSAINNHFKKLLHYGMIFFGKYSKNAKTMRTYYN